MYQNKAYFLSLSALTLGIKGTGDAKIIRLWRWFVCLCFCGKVHAWIPRFFRDIFKTQHQDAFERLSGEVVLSHVSTTEQLLIAAPQTALILTAWISCHKNKQLASLQNPLTLRHEEIFLAQRVMSAPESANIYHAMYKGERAVALYEMYCSIIQPREKKRVISNWPCHVHSGSTVSIHEDNNTTHLCWAM